MAGVSKYTSQTLCISGGTKPRNIAVKYTKLNTSKLNIILLHSHTL